MSVANVKRHHGLTQVAPKAKHAPDALAQYPSRNSARGGGGRNEGTDRALSYSFAFQGAAKKASTRSIGTKIGRHIGAVRHTFSDDV